MASRDSLRARGEWDELHDRPLLGTKLDYDPRDLDRGCASQDPDLEAWQKERLAQTMGMAGRANPRATAVPAETIGEALEAQEKLLCGLEDLLSQHEQRLAPVTLIYPDDPCPRDKDCRIAGSPMLEAIRLRSEQIMRITRRLSALTSSLQL